MKTLIEWRDEFFAGTHNYTLYVNGLRLMFGGYMAEELSGGKQRIKIDFNQQIVNTHAEAREIILEKQDIKV